MSIPTYLDFLGHRAASGRRPRPAAAPGPCRQVDWLHNLERLTHTNPVEVLRPAESTYE